MTRTSVEAADKKIASETTKSKETVEIDEDEDSEEEVEEEVEYEEVEEEVEEEEEEEEEVEEVDEEENMKDAEDEQGDEKKKHVELLALPPHGSEVYLGGIPNDASEDDLRAFCESVGEVTEVRIMKGKESGEARGYAFVTFRNKELASKAVEELNNSELKGKKIKCSTSQAKSRLFVGNVPRVWSNEDMKKALEDIGPGVDTIELLKDLKNPTENRGYAFIKYYNHACAEYSRQKMLSSKFKLDNNAPVVSWADSENPGSSLASQVKAIYVKNLPKDITRDRLKDSFEHHGKIYKVIIPPAKPGQENSRFGFVHFVHRSSALKALTNDQKYEIDGQVLECSLAKPQSEHRAVGAQILHNPTMLPNPTYPPHLGFGVIGGGYGALGAAGFGSPGFAQPLIYGHGPTPAGMAMMPMLLPDGRIGYVLQQPSLQPQPRPPHHRDGRSGPSGGRHGSESHRGRGSNRHHPYS